MCVSTKFHDHVPSFALSFPIFRRHPRERSKSEAPGELILNRPTLMAVKRSEPLSERYVGGRTHRASLIGTSYRHGAADREALPSVLVDHWQIDVHRPEKSDAA
jgi:hypothetical protein